LKVLLFDTGTTDLHEYRMRDLPEPPEELKKLRL
jgi:hypothetical protein